MSTQERCDQPDPDIAKRAAVLVAFLLREHSVPLIGTSTDENIIYMFGQLSDTGEVAENETLHNDQMFNRSETIGRYRRIESDFDDALMTIEVGMLNESINRAAPQWGAGPYFADIALTLSGKKQGRSWSVFSQYCFHLGGEVSLFYHHQHIPEEKAATALRFLTEVIGATWLEYFDPMQGDDDDFAERNEVLSVLSYIDQLV